MTMNPRSIVQLNTISFLFLFSLWIFVIISQRNHNINEKRKPKQLKSLPTISVQFLLLCSGRLKHLSSTITSIVGGNIFPEITSQHCACGKYVSLPLYASVLLAVVNLCNWLYKYHAYLIDVLVIPTGKKE